MIVFPVLLAVGLKGMALAPPKWSGKRY